jgi:hypothetical protein
MAGAPLSPDEISAYGRDGYVMPAARLPEELLSRISTAIEALIVTNPDIRPEQLVGAHVRYSSDSGVRGAEDLLECVRDPFMLDVIEQIIGPDIIMWGSQVFSKPAGDGMAIPWHQDGQYWPMRPLRSVTMWIAVDNVTTENGCMRIIPGTHGLGLLEHESSDGDSLALNQQLTMGTYDERAALNIELAPGRFSLHDAMVVHGSSPNSSGRRRCGYAIRYMPATSHFDRTIPPTRLARNQVIDFSQRPIWLVRGQDRANNDFSVGL